MVIFVLQQSNSMASISNTVELSHSVLPSVAVQAEPPPTLGINHNQQPNHFIYQGDETNFSQEVQSMREEEIDAIIQCNICIIGQEVKPANLKCLVMTLLVGICLVFPFFFFCCQWWKKAVSQIFQIKQQTYKQISKILKGKSLKTISIKIYDNFFSEQKIKILARGLNKRVKIAKLSIINEAGAFDMNDYQYSDFLANAKPFLKLTIKQYYIGWYKQFLKHQKTGK